MPSFVVLCKIKCLVGRNSICTRGRNSISIYCVFAFGIKIMKSENQNTFTWTPNVHNIYILSVYCIVYWCVVRLDYELSDMLLRKNFSCNEWVRCLWKCHLPLQRQTGINYSERVGKTANHRENSMNMEFSFNLNAYYWKLTVFIDFL